MNDDGNITDADRDYCGTPWAKMQLSFVFNAEWKNFDFSMMWNGQFGNKIYNVSRWQGRQFADNSNYTASKKVKNLIRLILILIHRVLFMET